MDRYVPMLGYRKAPTSDDYAVDEERTNESRIRHWALVWWENEDGGKGTAEFCVVTEYMPDFCGGLIVYSPRVETYRERGGWKSSFCSPGDQGDDKASCEWEDFDPTMAIDLAAFTGQEKWTEEQVMEYGWKCIAAKIGTQMYSQCRRGFMGADRDDGRLTNLVGVMNEMGQFAAIAPHGLDCTIANKDMKPLSIRTAGSGAVLSFSTTIQPKWMNANSGNKCHWVSGNCTPELHPVEEGSGYDDCYECGYEYDRSENDECPECGYMNEGRLIEKPYTMPPSVVEVLASPEYRRRVKRYYWRNG